MKILFTAAECAPFFKTGGLGDVAGALPKELAKNGHDVAVILPMYKKMPAVYLAALKEEFYDYVDVSWRHQYVGVKSLKKDGVLYYFLENDYYFDRDNLYGYYDDGERWAFFSLAVVQLMEKLAFIPDILHVNDFHTAMIPFLLKEKFSWVKAYEKIKTVLTIHNIAFQGAMDPHVLRELFGMDDTFYTNGALRLNDALNFLKGGIIFADKVNTVSPSYALEIQTPEFGEGLDSVLRDNSYKLSGILNGIDYSVNNPETDPYLPVHYSKDDLRGKKELKGLLQKKCGLMEDENVPLIGMVSRLTYQKGFHLVLERLEEILQNDVQVVLLGTGMKEIEEGFSYYASKYPDKFRAILDFDVALGQLIYGACDLFLMPSSFEPCGLSQMVAMHYGTLPIVHGVGGLKDTVIPYNNFNENASGFSFNVFDGEGLMYALNMGMSVVWEKGDVLDKMRQNAMSIDFSWKSKALLYEKLYQS